MGKMISDISTLNELKILDRLRVDFARVIVAPQNERKQMVDQLRDDLKGYDFELSVLPITGALTSAEVNDCLNKLACSSPKP